MFIEGKYEDIVSHTTPIPRKKLLVQNKVYSEMDCLVLIRFKIMSPPQYVMSVLKCNLEDWKVISVPLCHIEVGIL